MESRKMPTTVNDRDLAEYFRKFTMIQEWLVANFKNKNCAEKILSANQLQAAQADPLANYRAAGGQEMCDELLLELTQDSDDFDAQALSCVADKLVQLAYSNDDSFLYSPQLRKEIQAIHEIAVDDARRTKEHDISLNPYSTDGARGLWQQGWSGVRPTLLVDLSGNWRQWMLGVQARVVAEDTPLPVERMRA